MRLYNFAYPGVVLRSQKREIKDRYIVKGLVRGGACL